jgi:NTE family protein
LRQFEIRARQNHKALRLALMGSPTWKTALVLAGGGSLGAVQAGMLIELVATGLHPDFVVGVSAGALNGAFFAYDPSAAMAEHIAELWRRATTREVLGLSWRTVFGVFGRRGYLADARGLEGLLRRELPYKVFEETRIPLHIVAAEEVTGAEVLLSTGPVLEAVLASTAVPGIFPPVTFGGRALVDGVVADSTPIATSVRLGATRVIVLPCGFTCMDKAVPKHALGRAMHAITLLGARQLRQDFERYSERVSLRLVPPLCPLHTSSYDYSNGAALIDAARTSTRRWLDSGGLDRGGFPPELIAHSH